MRLLKNTWKNRELCLMALPGVLIMILFSYVPMYGLILAFKKFDFTLVFKSPWCGFDNFRWWGIRSGGSRVIRSGII